MDQAKDFNLVILNIKFTFIQVSKSKIVRSLLTVLKKSYKF